MYDCIIFDLDGVLIDVTDSYKLDVFREVEERLDDSFTERQIQNLWHGVGAESRDEILHGWGYSDPRRFWQVFDEIDSPGRRLEHTYAYEDVDALQGLDARMGVVTHSPPELAEPALQKTGLRDLFGSVVSCSYELGYKPSPEPILKCAGELGAEDAVMIGDSVSDVRGAWNAGLTAGHIDRVGHRVDADFNIESLREVPMHAANGGGAEVRRD